jgi:hypothetical protein
MLSSPASGLILRSTDRISPAGSQGSPLARNALPLDNSRPGDLHTDVDDAVGSTVYKPLYLASDRS